MRIAVCLLLCINVWRVNVDAQNAVFDFDAIKHSSFSELEQHLTDEVYLHKNDYSFVSIGHFFDKIQKHAIVVYLSNAFEFGEKDYRIDLFVYEVNEGTLEEIFSIGGLSSAYQSLKVHITDFNENGIPDLLVGTCEPEWEVTDHSENFYYHLFIYDPLASNLSMVDKFFLLPNPKFISPDHVYSYETCGCEDNCFKAKLFGLSKQQLFQVGLIEDVCTGIPEVYEIKGKDKSLLGELVDTQNRLMTIEDTWFYMRQ